MNKSLFIKKEVRKTLSLNTNSGKVIKFKIYNYTDDTKKKVFNMYEHKNRLNKESFELSLDELNLMFDLFTDYRFSVDELAEVVENPDLIFKQIFHEIEMILADLVILFIQEQEKMLADMKIKDELANLQQMLADGMKDIQESNPVEIIEE